MSPQVVGLELARARKRAGLTQAELAARMRTTQSAVSRLESGRFRQSFDAVDRYAEALGSPITLTFGIETRTDSRREKRARVRSVLRGYRFDPWEREPSPAEQRTLVADGLLRESEG